VGTDNQLERARLAEKFGAARVVDEFKPDVIIERVSDLLKYSSNPATPHGTFRNGAEQAARIVIETANSTADF
jgi:hypothetical protein